MIYGVSIFGDGLQAKNHSGVLLKRMANSFERIKLIILIGINMSSLSTVKSTVYKI
jgi:hypothetical protein